MKILQTYQIKFFYMEDVLSFFEPLLSSAILSELNQDGVILNLVEADNFMQKRKDESFKDDDPNFWLGGDHLMNFYISGMYFRKISQVAAAKLDKLLEWRKSYPPLRDNDRIFWFSEVRE